MATEQKRGKAKPAAQRSSPSLLSDLRSLRICVFHPHDEDGKELTRQLERIGCQAQAFWPPLLQPPTGTDLVFLALHPDILNLDFSWTEDVQAPPIVAVVSYENPTIIEAVLKIGAKAVVAAPIRSFGLLSALVLARELSCESNEQRKKILRLEAKLSGIRLIDSAQEILCKQRPISKEEAYRVIREQAMSKRTTMEAIASSIINANEILSFRA